MLGVSVTLLLGPGVPVPAPAPLIWALAKVEVHQTDDAPSGFQLTFNTEKSMTGLDYDVVNDPLLKEFSLVVVMVTVNLVPKVLIEGFITTKELTPGDSQRPATLVVTGDDVGGKLKLFDSSKSYPDMPDVTIVEEVLAAATELGIVEKEVVPPTVEVPLIDTTEQQVYSDFDWLKLLAHRWGHVFYVKPGLVPGESTAYWGPPARLSLPQSPLAIELGTETNVRSMSCSFNALAQQLTYGSLLEEGTVPTPFAAAAYTRVPPFSVEQPDLELFSDVALDPATADDQLPLLAARGRLMFHQGLEEAVAEAVAEGQTNLSTDMTVKLKGEFDVARYGGVLQAPGTVGVRGAGMQFDGLYYAQEATHVIEINPGSFDYSQSFTLIRGGLGTTTPEVKT